MVHRTIRSGARKATGCHDLSRSILKLGVFVITAVTVGPITCAGSLADSRIELIPGVYIAIEFRQLSWRDIEVADIMLRGILGAARVE